MLSFLLSLKSFYIKQKVNLKLLSSNKTQKERNIKILPNKTAVKQSHPKSKPPFVCYLLKL